MTELVKVHKRKLVIGLIIAALFIGFKWFGGQKSKAEEPEPTASEEVGPTEREASVVRFGDWAPTEYRTVLGQVESDSDVSVKAELNGTIARVNVSVGDQVRAGQALAGFKTSGDPTAINYQSALSSLETTKLSSQNSVRQAEISLENAQKSLQQTIAQQDQTINQAYESLRVEAQNIDTNLANALDTLDQYVQYSTKYKFNQSFAFYQVGNSNVVGKRTVQNQAQTADRAYKALTDLPSGSSQNVIVQGANARLRLLQELQRSYDSLELLLETTTANTRLSQTELNGFIADVEGVHASLDGKVATLQGQIENTKGVRESTRLSIINAQNGVGSAEAGLELARAQAEAQMIGAQNQVNIAGASTADLTVRAPISGTVTNKEVRVGDLVNPGQTLFTIVNEAQEKKVVAFLNQDEWRQAQAADRIDIEIDDQIITATSTFLSSQLDTQTQKVLAEFSIPPKTTLVGNLATVRIPIASSSEAGSNLLPFSAVSFEPDGAEVLVLDADGLAQRRKVVVGRVVVSNIEVASGLNAGDQVVEFYKRVLPGERVLAPNAPASVEAKRSDQYSDEDIKAMIVDAGEVTLEQIAVVREIIDDDQLMEFLELDPTNLKITLPTLEQVLNLTPEPSNE